VKDKIRYWLFLPKVIMRRPEREESDTVAFVEKIVALGISPDPRLVKKWKTYLHRLPTCIYFRDPIVCPMFLRVDIPQEAIDLWQARIWEELHLKYPIRICDLAHLMRCPYVKSYYYGEEEED